MVRIVERRVGFCYKYYIPSFQKNNNYSNLFDLKLAIIFFAIEDSPINRYYNSQNGGTMGVRTLSSHPKTLDFTAFSEKDTHSAVANEQDHYHP